MTKLFVLFGAAILTSFSGKFNLCKVNLSKFSLDCYLIVANKVAPSPTTSDSTFTTQVYGSANTTFVTELDNGDLEGGISVSNSRQSGGAVTEAVVTMPSSASSSESEDRKVTQETESLKWYQKPVFFLSMIAACVVAIILLGVALSVADWSSKCKQFYFPFQICSHSWLRSHPFHCVSLASNGFRASGCTIGFVVAVCNNL